MIKAVRTDSNGDAKNKLLHAGLELIGQRGFEGASIRDIALKSGQNVAAISYHYGDKSGLYSAIINYVSEQFRNEFKSVNDEINKQLLNGGLDSDAVIILIKKLLDKFIRITLSNEAVFVYGFNIMYREQISPSSIYPLIYLYTYQPLQKTLSSLIAVLTKQIEETEDSIILSYTLLGLCTSYRFNQSNINLAFKWNQVDSEKLEGIIKLALFQIELILRTKVKA